MNENKKTPRVVDHIPPVLHVAGIQNMLKDIKNSAEKHLKS